MSQPLIEVRNFSFQYNQSSTVALSEIDLTITKGEFIGVVGANGAGKSTLCNALVGLIPNYFVGHYAGAVRIGGRETTKVTVGELSQSIGLVFQNPFNQLSYTADTVAEELAYGLGNRGVPREQMMARIAEIAELMSIDQLLEKNPLELSGGQVQRVALASAIILAPQILVLDECTTQLDPLGTQQIMAIVKRLSEEGMTIIMVDHDMERIAQMADRVVVMSEGRMPLMGTPREVFSAPELADYQIQPPDFYEITKELVAGELPALTEAEALKQLQEVLKDEN